MKKIIAVVLATIMLLVCSLSSFADAEQAQVGFMNDPISIAGRNESYEEYFQNEHGFYLDNSSQIANVFTSKRGYPHFTMWTIYQLSQLLINALCRRQHIQCTLYS